MRILIIKPSSLGDIIHALVVAAAIRTHRPDARIDWVARDIFAPIVRACTEVERTHVFERAGGVLKFLRLARELRQTRYDVVLDMQGLARSAILARLTRAPLILGRADGREGARRILRRHAVMPAGQSHAIDKLLGFLPRMGLPASLGHAPEFAGLKLPEAAAGIPAGRALVIFPDSRRPEKEWPHFQKLTDLLLRQHPDRPVVWCGKSPLTPSPDWPAERFLNLCNRTSLPEAVALITHAALVIANDSGPMHIAAAVNTPVLALFGPTDPALYGPYPADRPTNRVLRAPGGDLARLRPEPVAAEALTMLGLTPPRAHAAIV